jgi:two-component system, OmpR family, sensor kinase
VTLRTRLAIALVLVAAVLGLVVLLVPRAVERAQIDQLDSQLAAVVPIARGQVPGPRPVGGSGPVPQGPGGFSDVYVASVGADGTRSVIVTSRYAADREPAPTDQVSRPPSFEIETVGSLDGNGGSWRALQVVSPGSDGGLLLAIPLDQVETTTNDVRWTLAVGGLAVLAMLVLAGWWVLRLGLRPIADVTAVADAIAAGDRHRRATAGHGNTEADQLARAVNTMLDQRNAAEDRLRQFVADASHELRTPVAAIRGFTDLYRAGGLTDDDALDQAMRRIGQESKRMGVLVEDLLLLAGLDQGRPLELSTVDVGALLADVVLDASATHPSRQVVLDVADDLVVIGDDARLRQVAANLLTNALTYAGPSASIRITGRRIDDVCAIEVADDGVGMDADTLAHAFDRFWRGDESRARSESGAGLGLSIVRAIVDAHGGLITITSAPGAGTQVRVAVPVGAVEPSANPQGVSSVSA